VFVRNRADKGGALRLSGPAVAAVLQSCTFTENAAHGFAGAVSVVGHSHMSATSCAFHNNTAGTTGGAIETADFGRVVLAGDTQGVGNMATHGGFLGMEANSRAEVVGATLARNMALKDGDGGCCTIFDNAVAIVHNITIVGGEKQPNIKAGAFSVGDNATLLVSSCMLSHLHAAQGACIYASDTRGP
jgi:predicted outer membrane repeat protein